MNEFPVAKDSYIAFDGLSIKEKIKERLNQTRLFTDQNYEGSNIAGINDSIAMSFSLLMYYLNQSSVNGQFSETTVYENMNRIVKELDYKPVGHQTASVSFTMTGNNLGAGIYTIPRYSNLSIGGVIYSFSKDVSFTKTIDNTPEAIKGIDSDTVLHQGTFVEMPLYTPSGNANEIIYITASDNSIVDNFNIDVYVQTDGVWKEWSKTQSLYINNSSDEVFEVRFNENKRYEIKFGDDINGKRLQNTDRVLIYYLLSNGVDGEIGVSALQNKKIAPSVSFNLQTILDSSNSIYMSQSQLLELSLNNKFPSTYYSTPESIESIRKNAPGVFRSQFSITTKKSYETFVKSNFSYIIHDSVVMNNSEYLDSYIKYFYELGLTKPQNESRALFNQVNYADACNFNNVYIFCVPKSVKSSLAYLTPSQKTLIINSISDEQVLTSETVLADPVYIAFDMCLKETNSVSKETIQDSELLVVKTQTNRRSDSSIKNDIQNVINDFFSVENNTLGQSVNIQQLNTSILNIEGVSQIYTRNKSTRNSVEGIKMLYWNPVYFDLTATEAQSLTNLYNFQYPFLNNKIFVDRITLQ